MRLPRARRASSWVSRIARMLLRAVCAVSKLGCGGISSDFAGALKALSRLLAVDREHREARKLHAELRSRAFRPPAPLPTRCPLPAGRCARPQPSGT